MGEAKRKKKVVNEICIPYNDPEQKAQRLSIMYMAAEAHDLILADLRDEETGEIKSYFLGVDADSGDKVRLLPLAQWVEAKDLDGKSLQVYNPSTEQWVNIKETKLTPNTWQSLKWSTD